MYATVPITASLHLLFSDLKLKMQIFIQTPVKLCTQIEQVEKIINHNTEVCGQHLTPQQGFSVKFKDL